MINRRTTLSLTERLSRLERKVDIRENNKVKYTYATFYYGNNYCKLFLYRVRPQAEDSPADLIKFFETKKEAEDYYYKLMNAGILKIDGISPIRPNKILPIKNDLVLKKYLKRVDKIIDTIFDDEDFGNLTSESFIDAINAKLMEEEQIYLLRDIRFRDFSDSFSEEEFLLFNFELSDQGSYGNSYLLNSIKEAEDLKRKNLLKHEFISFEVV